MAVNLNVLQTESRNPDTTKIDQVTTLEVCKLVNNEDLKVAIAVERCLPDIAKAIDSLVSRIQRGGRVIYVGAGTSGRLAVLDASELPPTFNANPDQFIALIAGGDNALRHAQEGAEDDVDAAVADLKMLSLDGDKDSLIGIAASGRTPFVLSCIAYARSLGCCTVGIACSSPSAMSQSGQVDHMISAITGPEVVTGSTRLKAGTATKLVLNLLSTGTMIKTGKTYGNIMIDVKATNAKLKQRARNILRTVCGDRCLATDVDIDQKLQRCDGSVKLAAASLMLHSSVSEARERLSCVGGSLAKVLEQAHQDDSPPDSSQTNGHPESKYVLCIDGGGSKCAAVIRAADGEMWRGESGPCNPTDVGLDAAISSIKVAVEKVADRCPGLKGKPLIKTSFARIWIGLAGYDRPSISNPIIVALEKLFSRPTSNTFQITTDIDLFVTAAAQQTGAATVIALVAGTGSIAMRFSREGDIFKQTGRSGGWGYLLGDDGSGFDIGRQAIRHCLASLDHQRNAMQPSCSCSAECVLCQRVLEYFVPGCEQDQRIDLLSAVITSSGVQELSSSSTTKKRIASIAPIVIEASRVDATAKAIIDRAINDLVELVKPLNASTDNAAPKSVSVLAGGLIQSDLFQAALKSRLSKPHRSEPAQEIRCVPDPASAGAEYLAR